MLRLQRVWLVLRREYLYNFRRPAFLFTAFGVPLISFGAMFLMTQFLVNRETNLDSFQRVGYIDRVQVIEAGVSSDMNYVAVNDPALDVPAADADTAAWRVYYDALEAAANQQLQDGALDAYFVLSDNYLITGAVDLYADQKIPQQLVDDINWFLKTQIVAKAPEDLSVPVARLEGSNYTLRDLNSGDKLTDAALAGRLLLPFIFVMLYFMATNTTAQFLMSGVVEEKENRLMEILATSLRPIELLWGKLLGLGALALTQVIVWAGAGLVITQINDDAQAFLSGAEFAPLDLLLLFALFVINFLLFSAIMLGVGASATAESESRQVAGIFIFASVLPFMFLGMFFENPDGAVPVGLSFFPLTAATALILRMGLGALPAWQLWTSFVIQIGSVLAVMWLGAKIFRLGMLMYGKPLTPRTLITALRQGQTTLTSSAEDRVSAPKKQRKGWLRR
jgi:ABC-2 type transport system permease protein